MEKFLKNQKILNKKVFFRILNIIFAKPYPYPFQLLVLPKMNIIVISHHKQLAALRDTHKLNSRIFLEGPPRIPFIPDFEVEATSAHVEFTDQVRQFHVLAVILVMRIFRAQSSLRPVQDFRDAPPFHFKVPAAGREVLVVDSYQGRDGVLVRVLDGLHALPLAQIEDRNGLVEVAVNDEVLLREVNLTGDVASGRSVASVIVILAVGLRENCEHPAVGLRELIPGKLAERRDAPHASFLN